MAENIAITVMLSVPDLHQSFQSTAPRTLWTVLLSIFITASAGK